MTIEVAVDVLGPEPQPLADADGPQLTAAHELVHLGAAHPEELAGLVHRQQRPDRGGNWRYVVATHGSTVTAQPLVRVKGDERRWTLRDECPDAVQRLQAFRWEWLRTCGTPDDAEWVRRRGKPVTVDHGINPDGLLKAIEEVLCCVQRRFYRFHDAGVPLDDMIEVSELHNARIGALTALYWLGNKRATDGGQRFAKDVEASMAPNGQPLALCVGSNKREQVPVYFRGHLSEWPMTGYIGCLRTFPDASFGRGRRWPRLCPRCGDRKTNHREAARTALRERAAEIADAFNSGT